MTGVRAALLLSIAERYLLLVIAFGSNLIIARLLLPEQIGVYSVSLAVLSVAQALRDFGIGSYLIQEARLDREKVRTALGVSLILGLTLFALFALAAPWVAAFYKEPRMEVTIRIVSINFLLLPVSTVSLSLLRRDMQFRRLIVVTIVATALGAAASVALAWHGVGENSLAIGSVVTNLFTGCGAWILRSDREVLLPSLIEWRSVLKFGGQSSLAGVVTSISMDSIDLFVGRILGFHSVAMLSRAQGLMNLFHRDLMGAVRNVALPAFAAAHRQGSPLAEPYLRSVATVLVVAWPFYGMVALFSDEFLLLLFGDQWRDAGPLVPVFCAAGALAAVNALTPNLLVAIGRLDLLVRVELTMQPLRVALIVCAALWFKTTMACALAFCLSAAITLPVMWWFKRQCVPDDLAVLRRLLRSTLLVTGASLGIPLVYALLLPQAAGPVHPYGWVAVMAAGALLGLLTLRWFEHPLSEEPIYRKLVGRALSGP